jgi:hypothetical protein
MAHRNSGFSHCKWWIFPLLYVSLPEGNVGKTMSWVVGIPSIKMMMTGGWFMALAYPH